MGIFPVNVSLSLSGFSKGSNQLKLKGYPNSRQIIQKIAKKKVVFKAVQQCALQSKGFTWLVVMLFAHTGHACAGKGKLKPAGDGRLSITVENKFK